MASITRKTEAIRKSKRVKGGKRRKRLLRRGSTPSFKIHTGENSGS